VKALAPHASGDTVNVDALPVVIDGDAAAAA
jgi:hypothetical protein